MFSDAFVRSTAVHNQTDGSFVDIGVKVVEHAFQLEYVCFGVKRIKWTHLRSLSSSLLAMGDIERSRMHYYSCTASLSTTSLSTFFIMTANTPTQWNYFQSNHRTSQNLMFASHNLDAHFNDFHHLEQGLQDRFSRYVKISATKLAKLFIVHIRDRQRNCDNNIDQTKHFSFARSQRNC